MPSFRELVLERTAGLSLGEMAALLGIHKSYACFLRLGTRGNPRLSERVARRALQAWPDLAPAYLQDALNPEDEPTTDAAAKSEAVA